MIVSCSGRIMCRLRVCMRGLQSIRSNEGAAIYLYSRYYVSSLHYNIVYLVTTDSEVDVVCCKGGDVHVVVAADR